MQDPRIRLVSTIFLSCAAWISITGAIFALFWWILCGKARTSFRSLRTFGLTLIVPIIMGIAAMGSGQNGISYFIRITTILIIASWMYIERYPGELLDVGVFFGGRKIGFDLGLIGELTMSTLEVLAKETTRVSIAVRQKGTRISPQLIPAVFSGVLIRQLQLAQDRATLLTLRGYNRGGMHCPSFHTPYSDWIIGAFSCAIFLFSLYAGDFFIISGSNFIV